MKVVSLQPDRGGRRHIAAVLFLACTFLVSGGASACGMHGISFGMMAAVFGKKSTAPALPPGTSLSVPTRLDLAAGEEQDLTIDFSAPPSLTDAALAVAGPTAMQIAGPAERPVPAGDGTVTVAVTAPPGYHRLAVHLSGTVKRETVRMTRYIHVIVEAPAEAGEVAAR